MMNVTVTFDHFDAPFTNRSIKFPKIDKIMTPTTSVN